jgi:hypothetical protein
MLEGLKAVARRHLPPQGGATVKAWSRIGYELQDAIADLIDNSIDAEAGRVEITLFRNDHEVTSLTIADDGQGMNGDQLDLGMQFGGRSDHDPADLGAYGMGLKAASFSQCETMTVVTRQGGITSAARWAAEQINNDWACEILDAEGSDVEFRRLCLPTKRPATGTLVVWDKLTRLGVGGGDDDLDTFLATAVARLEAHLGLVFHRFLSDGALVIQITVRHERRPLALPRTVKARDPFDYPMSGADDWPQSLQAELPGLGALDMVAHIWPAASGADGFLLGTRNGLPYQGFYFYRNNRIVQAGGWNDAVRNNQDPDLLLARVAVELPQGGNGVNVQKSGLQVTAAQSQALSRAAGDGATFEDFLEAAREAMAASKRVTRAAKTVPLTPGQGMPMPTRKAAAKLLVGDAHHEPLDFVWETLEDDEVFRLDLSETRLLLNKTYRRDILGEAPASGADAPFVKMLLFLLFKGDFERLRFSAKRTAELETCNALLLDALGR